MPFICSHHRKHILKCTKTANTHWNNWTSQGMQLLNDQRPDEAVSFFGCSLDVATWLVDQPKVYQLNQLNEYFEKLSLSSFLLAECCSRINQPEFELHFLLQLHHRLLEGQPRQVSLAWPLSGYIRQSFERLKDYVERYGIFKGYETCLQDTRDRLQALNLNVQQQAF